MELIPEKKTAYKIILIGLLYILALNLFTLIIFKLQITSLKTNSIKEMLFGVWGYGWDGMHYIRIALIGYKFPLIAFFPLYPLLLKFVDFLLPLTLAYRINLVLLFPMLFLLYKLADKKLESLVLFLAFPSAFFLQANYTETLFILIAAFGLLALVNKKYFIAAVTAGLLTATKTLGVSLSVVLVLAMVLDFKDQLIKKPKVALKFISLGLLSISGIILYFSFLTYKFQTPVIYFEAQKEWGRQLGQPSDFFQRLFPPIYKEGNFEYNREVYRRILDPLVVILAIFLLIHSYRKMNRYVWLFSLFNVLIPILTGSLMSFSRLFLLCFPLILYLGKIVKKPKYIYMISLIFFTLQLYAIYLFFNTMFVG